MMPAATTLQMNADVHHMAVTVRCSVPISNSHKLTGPVFEVLTLELHGQLRLWQAHCSVTNRQANSELTASWAFLNTPQESGLICYTGLVHGD